METPKSANKKAKELCKDEIIAALSKFEEITGLSVKAIALDNANGAVNVPFAQLIITATI